MYFSYTVFVCIILAIFSGVFFELILVFAKISASNLFGVIIVASGIMNFLKSSMADFFMSIPPVVDLITGSTTIGIFNFFKYS